MHLNWSAQCTSDPQNLHSGPFRDKRKCFILLCHADMTLQLLKTILINNYFILPHWTQKGVLDWTSRHNCYHGSPDKRYVSSLYYWDYKQGLLLILFQVSGLLKFKFCWLPCSLLKIPLCESHVVFIHTCIYLALKL